MARYKVILAYDGTDFHGFQRQEDVRTVQAETEKALRNLKWTGQSILAAGRTDTGVHATGQVIAFDLDWNHPPEVLGRALNANLPKDIAAKQVIQTAAGFHPRFDACWRRYEYQIYFAEERDPLVERFTWRIDTGLNMQRLNDGAQLLLGAHDFSAFGSAPSSGGSTFRTVAQAFWRGNSEKAMFLVVANAFLYHMVRRIVYLLVMVGCGQLSLCDLKKGVNERQAMTPGLAPPHGLVLSEVYYTDDWQG